MTTYTDLDKSLTFAESNLKDQVHRFGEEVLRPAAATLDPLPPKEVIAEGSVFWDVFRKAYQLGFHTSGLPEALGGVEISPPEPPHLRGGDGLGKRRLCYWPRRGAVPIQFSEQ